MTQGVFRRLVTILSAALLVPLTLAGIPMSARAAAVVGIAVDASQKFQTMGALGVNINPNSWDNGNLRPALDMLIDKEGVKTFRVAMDMIDWESTNDDSDPHHFNWNYYDPIYSGAKSFDTQYAGSNFANTWDTIDYLHQKGIPDSGIMLSFMGPGPAWMGGNTLDSAMEDEYVEEVLSAAYYGYSHGHTFGLFSPDNEWDINANEGISMSSTLYADAMNRLAVRMNQLGMTGVRLIGPESAFGFDVSDMTAYPTLMAKLDHFDLHDYTGSTQGAAQDVAGTGKDFWVSEYNQFDQSFPLLNQGASGLMVWEAYDSVYNHAILNGHGRDPGNDSYGNTALIAYDAKTKTYTPRIQFYEFGQLFKFVPVGARRIGTSSTNANVETEAFQDPASSRLTVVGKNNSDSAQTLTLSMKNLGAVPDSLEYYQTNSDDNLARGADLAVNGGSATVTVPAGTVFTLTGLGTPDSEAPSAPTNLTASGTTGAATLHWGPSTDNVGVTGYLVYRSQSSGFTPSATEQVGETADTSFTDSGLRAGTYYYRVAAQDAAGNISAPSNEDSATVTADTTAPTVSITSPDPGATLTGTASVTASAADDVGVTGVQFKLDGANLGSEVTSAPYSMDWDTTATTNGLHTLTAVARDAAGNTTSSSPVSVTVNNASPGALLLGSRTVQGSADSNPDGEAEAFKFTASASGAATALSFYVDSGSAATTLTVGVYADAGGQPGSLLTDGSTNAPKSGAWNTVTLSSTPMLTSGSPYWIGLLGTGGQLNYRDAASGGCSQSDAAEPLTALPATWSTGTVWSSCDLSAYVSAAATPDTTPPSVPTGLSQTDATQTTATLNWNASTDDVGVAGYHYYGADPNPLGTTAETSVTYTGLSCGNSYAVGVDAYDAAGNVSPEATTTLATAACGAAPPVTLDTKVTTDQSAPASSITSPAISTAQPAELLVAFLASDGPAVTTGQSFSSVTGGDLTWTLRKRVNTRYGTSEIWTAPAETAVKQMTVTATRRTGSYVGSITVAAFQNADLATVGATGGASAISGAPSAALVATRTGSVVAGVGNDWDTAVPRAVGPRQALVDQFRATATGDTFWVQRLTGNSAAGQRATINDTAPIADQWNLATIEVLPAS